MLNDTNVPENANPPDEANEPGQQVQHPTIRQLVAVYNADGGLVGDLRYVAGKIRGTTKCSLCSLTHPKLRKSREFFKCAESFEVPLEVLHRNEVAPEVRAHIGSATPQVVAVTDAGCKTLLTTQVLDNIKTVPAFKEALDRAIEGLS